MKIAELFAEITLKGGKETITSLKGILTNTTAVKAGLVAATAALYKMSDVARKTAMEMDVYQLNTGLSTIQLQKLSFQAAQAGVSMSELGGAIEHLQQINANARLGKGYPGVFTQLGLTPGQDPVHQLNVIGRKLRELRSYNPDIAKNYADQLGLSDKMYYVLLKGGNDQLNKQFILTNKEQQALVSLNKQWNQFWYYIKQIGIKLSGITAVLQTRFVKMMSNALQLVGEVLVKLFKIIDAHKSLKYLIAAVGMLVAWYFAPWFVVLSGIALILDDIMGYFDGRDSITGRIVNWLKKSEAFQGLLLLINDSFKMIIGTTKALGKVIEALVNSPIGDMLKLYFEFAKTEWGRKAIDAALKSAGTIMNPLGTIGNGYNDLRPAIAGANSVAQDFVSNQVNNVHIDYMGSGDAKQDAQDMGNTLVGYMVNRAARQNPFLKYGANRGGPKYGSTPIKQEGK